MTTIVTVLLIVLVAAYVRHRERRLRAELQAAFRTELQSVLRTELARLSAELRREMDRHAVDAARRSVYPPLWP